MGLITKAKGAPRGESGSSGGGVKYICNVCSNDITSTVRIRCASKSCSDYDLCVTCFSEAKHNIHHDPRTHPYQVIEPHSIPIFDPSWGADEELLLLEGAEQYGLGSWADIADHIGGYREKDEVRDHYISTYVHSKTFPLPERASPSDTRLSDSVPRDEFQARKKRRIEERKEAISEVSQTVPTPAKPTSSIPSCHEVAGYMPGRLEFESEYFNEAEEAVQHMQFSPDEGINPQTNEFEAETQLKMVVMNIYNDRLTARTDRKRVIFAHHLLDYRKNIAIDKKRTREQRDLHHRLKPFARIMSHPDFESLASDLEKEQNLRAAIAQLQEWRRMRIVSLSSGEKYENEKATRLQKHALQAAQYERLSNSLTGSGGGVRQKPALAPEPPAREIVEFTTKDLPVRLTPMAGVTVNGGDRFTVAGAPAENLPTPPSSETSPNKPLASTSTPSTTTTARQPLAPIPNLTPLKLEPENAQSLQLLDPGERDLCSKLRLQPKAYFAIKEVVLREATRNEGRLKKKVVRELAKVDTTKGGRIFEFFVERGWVLGGKP
ncbi:hypothetical protein LTR62_004743 [Meristemomyces frigidus]|uniref:Transcriptional adapter 2 n=1 Tax=Meristemomyces frigidus TaxID=1508187 RepID=A0AAN7TLI5_9PEZI|nr:hypothetical protein LTR62_004743 [Meristemomyces frigidus]